MQFLFSILFLGVVVTLGQAQNHYKNLKQEKPNFVFYEKEIVKNNDVTGETKVKARLYYLRPNKKWTNNIKHNKDGLLIKSLRPNDETKLKEINNEKATTLPTTSTIISPIIGPTLPAQGNNNNKMSFIDLFFYKIWVSHSQPKIESNENLHKYFSSQVALFSWSKNKNNIPMCAGSLISDRYVLTTANCVEHEKRVVMIFGARNIQNSERSQIKAESSHYIIHENWNSSSGLLQDNIALIKLPQPIKFNEYISPVNLPTKADRDKRFADQNATIVAWSSDYEADTAKLIKETDVIMTHNKCYSVYPFIVNSHICISGFRSNTSCVGESGDQLFVEDKDGKSMLVGLLSFGMEHGCRMKQPVVFTRVTSYLPWIKRNAKM